MGKRRRIKAAPSNQSENARKPAGKSVDDEDICPVCDLDCNCGQSAGISKTINTRSNRRKNESSAEEGDDIVSAASGPHKHSKTSSKSLAGLRRIYESTLQSSSENDEEVSVIVTGRGMRLRKRKFEQEVTDHGSSSSDEAGLSSDDSELLKIEEHHIQLGGIDSDEEENEIPHSNGTASDKDHPPLDHDVPLEDPNEIDHVWSTEDEHSSNSETDYQSILRINTEPSFLLKAVAELPVTNKRSSKMCKKRFSASGSPDTSLHPQRASSTANLSPEMIQTYLASRGIHISAERAIHFAESIYNGSFFSMPAESSSSKHRPKPSSSSSKPTQDENPENTIYTTRYSAPDPKMLSKEAKQYEALQAQALGGLSGHSKSSLLMRRGDRELVQEPEISSMDLEELLDINSDNLSSLSESETVSDVDNMTDVSSRRGNPTKWDRIPISTFRRSRKISAPLLKLSQAVKSTFGVVPRAIHETLLGCGSEEMNVLPESVVYLPSKSDMRSSSRSSVLVGPPTHELGLGSAVEKKLSSKKNEILKTVRKREKELNSLLSFAGKKDESSEDDTSNCSCSECEVETPLSIAQKHPSGSRHKARRGSLPLHDLSYLIHDPTNPPSACASPDNLFLTSPSLFAHQQAHHVIEMEKLELEPAVIETMIDRSPYSHVMQTRRRRKSSIFNAGRMSISKIEPLLNTI